MLPIDQSNNDERVFDFESFMNNGGALVDQLNERRRVLAEQQRANDVQFDMCDEVRAHRRSAGLEEAVKELKTSDRALYDYIEYLELLRYGTYCNGCRSAKRIEKNPTNIICDNLLRLQEYADGVMAGYAQELDILARGFAEVTKQITAAGRAKYNDALERGSDDDHDSDRAPANIEKSD